MVSFISNNIDDMDIIAGKILSLSGSSKLYAIYGNMGAGKTTLIKTLCKHLGVDELVNSPTFTIINEYNRANNEKVFHLDCYRIKDIKELYEIGIEEYFNSDSYCFIEWPNILEHLLPSETNIINITEDINLRHIELVINKSK